MHIFHCGTRAIFISPGIGHIAFASRNGAFYWTGRGQHRTARIRNGRQAQTAHINVGVASYCFTCTRRSRWSRNVDRHRVHIVHRGARTIRVGPGVGNITFAGRNCTLYRAGHGHRCTARIIHCRWRR